MAKKQNLSKMVQVEKLCFETSLRKAVISQSERSVFLCDGSKFNVKAPYNLINLNEIDFVITNNNLVDIKNAIIVK